MRFLRYCRRCVMPETKPDLLLDGEQICNACRSFENRKVVDWDQRAQELQQILARHRRADGSNYDCVIPVSGGKDSTFQVIRMLQLGMNPICVTSTTDSLSAIGRRNIENIKRLGVDYIEVTCNPNVRRAINRLALRQVGDISWPEHATIFTIPVRMAVQLKVPLIIWGENSQDEYGGPATAATNRHLTRRWLEEFGGLLGLGPVCELPGVLPKCPPARSLKPKLVPIPEGVCVQMTCERNSRGKPVWVFEAMSLIEIADPADEDRKFNLYIGGAE